ncbi:DUF4386 family protein [Myceligenerans indicum]|uniref:DUF4386 family protein n=1 Tax=Myceligenerans indicum TaxID=2593663 RepID=A0ABS1LPY7_9MICO|nr:DUF4386 family protein [Myceligenerans indicum]MBL0888351.1 hypothetical protein [Myceligenerans indicum]
MTIIDTAAVLPDVARFRGLVRTGAWAAFAGVALILVQIPIYAAWPPPGTTQGLFELLADDPVRGLITLDVLYVVSNLLAYLLYLALAVALWRVSPSAVVVALAFGTLGMAAYLASPRAVEMLTLARAYQDAGADERVALLATGDGMVATWIGTAFDVYYLFNLVALLVLAVLMYRSAVFGRATAWWGLTAALLMAVPSSFGTLGLVFALVSLAPWSVFAVLVGRRMLGLLATAEGREPGRARADEAAGR